MKNKKYIVLVAFIVLVIVLPFFFFDFSGDSKKSITVTECANNNTDFDCYQNYYAGLVQTKGPEAAFVDLKERFKTNSYVVSQCHPITHVIGRFSAMKYKTPAEAYKFGDPFCWSGYYHGVMEQIIDDVGMNKIAGELNTICNGIAGKETYSFDYYNCVHGLGHGLMAITNNELFESLDICDNLSGQWEKLSCYGGVFMENVIVDNKNHFTKYLKPAEPIYPCNAVKDSYKEQCYLMQTSYMLKVNAQDFRKVFPICRVVDKGYEDTCFQSLGRDASGQSSSNAIKTKQTCDLGINDFEKENCLIGAVKDFVSYYHSDKEANGLCALYSGNLKKVCSETVVTYYKNF